MPAHQHGVSNPIALLRAELAFKLPSSATFRFRRHGNPQSVQVAQHRRLRGDGEQVCVYIATTSPSPSRCYSRSHKFRGKKVLSLYGVGSKEPRSISATVVTLGIASYRSYDSWPKEKPNKQGRPRDTQKPLFISSREVFIS